MSRHAPSEPTTPASPIRPAVPHPHRHCPRNAGSSIDHVYRTRMYLTHVDDWQEAGRIHGQFFAKIRPAATMVVIAALLNPAWRIEIEADAFIPA